MAGQWWSNPVYTALGGFIAGLLTDEAKRRFQAFFQQREARRRLYDDLGAYLGRVEALSLLNKLDLLLWNEVISPKTPNFDYYSAHESGVLLRADTKRGVQLLVERLRGLGSAYNSMTTILATGKTDDTLPGVLLGDVVNRYQVLLDEGLLNRRLLAKACKKRRQTIAKRRPPLLLAQKHPE